MADLVYHRTLAKSLKRFLDSNLFIGAICLFLLVGACSIIYVNVHLESKVKENEKLYRDIVRKSQNAFLSECQDSINGLPQWILTNGRLPVVLTDDQNNISYFKNIGIPDSITDSLSICRAFNKMLEYPCDTIHVDKDGMVQTIYYGQSDIMGDMYMFTASIFVIVGVVAAILYILFSSKARRRKDAMWQGVSREVAHQLSHPQQTLLSCIDAVTYKVQEGIPFLSDDELVMHLSRAENSLSVVRERFGAIDSEVSLKFKSLYDSLAFFKDFKVSGCLNVRFEVVEKDRGVVVWHSPSLINWAVENLCRNAAQAIVEAYGSNADGVVSVYISSVNQYAVVDVSDNGPGIPKKNWRKVFNSGYTTKKKGWGVGLSLVERIVEDMHDGTIKILQSSTDDINHGTTFRITLPGCIVDSK